MVSVIDSPLFFYSFVSLMRIKTHLISSDPSQTFGKYQKPKKMLVKPVRVPSIKIPEVSFPSAVVHFVLHPLSYNMFHGRRGRVLLLLYPPS